MDKIKHKILVLSGKGGVGKSTVATQVAMLLAMKGLKVGLLDVDLCGPSIPTMLGLQGTSVYQNAQAKIVPVVPKDLPTLHVMSIAFILPGQDSAVIFRGPKKTTMISKFLVEVEWGELDYLIIDTPPGSGDEHISLWEHLCKWNPDGAVIVTTPQDVSTADNKREISFCKTSEITILGLIENMSGFVCPTCQECTYIFSKGGGEALAKEHNIPFIGYVPIDPEIANAGDDGKSFIDANKESTSLKCIEEWITNLTKQHHYVV